MTLEFSDELSRVPLFAWWSRDSPAGCYPPSISSGAVELVQFLKETSKLLRLGLATGVLMSL